MSGHQGQEQECKGSSVCVREIKTHACGLADTSSGLRPVCFATFYYTAEMYITVLSLGGFSVERDSYWVGGCEEFFP